MKVRTRIAPSPTGDPHVGTAYIALFNYCFARQHDGEFILRIEDTDQARSTEASERAILDSLRWLGLQWQEGPDVGGPHGPYRQSERSAIYREHVDRLLGAGHAFRCFCTAERLDDLRNQQREAKSGKTGYDGHCLGLRPDEVEQRLAAGDAHVVRMKVPREGVCVVSDFFRGNIDIAWDQVDMQILLKADGLPTYHLANVVDDHLMDVTHVLRGEEWITSAPKHLKLYEYFGWQAPVLCHLPLLRNPDGSKLSKRKNPTSVGYYEKMGFLPEALLNFLGNMGWSMADGEEKFALATMVEKFDLQRVKLGGPVFDLEKLSWLNGRWIREELSVAQLAQRLETWAFNRGRLESLLPMVHERVQTLSEVFPKLEHFYRGLPELSAESFVHKKIDAETCRKYLQFVAYRLEELPDFEAETIKAQLGELATAMDVEIRDLLFPVFVAMSGSAVTTPLFESLAQLGKDLARARLRHAITALGGVGKKLGAKLEKQYRGLPKPE